MDISGRLPLKGQKQSDASWQHKHRPSGFENQLRALGDAAATGATRDKPVAADSPNGETRVGPSSFSLEAADEWQVSRAARRDEALRNADLMTLNAFTRFAQASGQTLAQYIEDQAKPQYHQPSPIFGQLEGFETPAAMTREKADALLALAKEQKLI